MRLRGWVTSKQDRGATLALVAASLFLLMGFAAIAVDAGIAFGDRRQQQSAGDVGALAAVQFAKTTLSSSHPACDGLTGADLAACRGAEEALAVIEGTLPGRYDDDDWAACTDPNPGDYVRASAISDCIRFTQNMQRARVVLPGTDVGTYFARVIGFNSVAVGAFAEAGLEMDIVGGVFPFAAGPSGASANQACFVAGDNTVLDISPCGPGVEGNYGKLDIRLYGNENYGTPKICSGQNAQRMATNIITGSDHPMERANPVPPGTTVNDFTNCPTMSNPVNQLDTWTGNAHGPLDTGFFQQISTPALPGRLICKNGNEGYPLGDYVSTQCAQVNNQHLGELDHTPLWEFIDPGASGTIKGSGGACAPGQLDDRASMEACLAAWKANGPHDEPLFNNNLVTSTRFGAVPRLHADPGSGTGSYWITDFLPVYIETVYLQCTALTCQVVHSPGEDSNSEPPGNCPTPITSAVSSCGWPSTGNKNIEAVTAFILTMDMLPEEIAENFPYQPGTVVYNLYR